MLAKMSFASGYRFTLALSVLAALCVRPIPAQTTFASITGTVTDPAGAVIAGAKIEATHVASNYRYTTQANELGYYTLAQLREGTYVLRASAAGFEQFEASDIQLVARDMRRVDIQLVVGAVQSSIEVSAGAAVIETETARIGDTRSSYAIKALPVSRDLWNYLVISPAITPSSEGAWRRFSGSGRAQSSASIDGVATDDFEGGNQISPLTGYVDSFAEIRVDSANNSAEFGSVGVVTVISKSGTNQLHGTVFDYYTTPFFRARNPFASARGIGIRHSPGGSISGPVLLPKLYDGRNKTFFFYSLETSRGSAVQQNLNPTVPIEAWRNGDFSKLAPGTVVRDPLTGTPYPNNIIPASAINPVSKKIQDRFYPLPNFGDTTVFQNQNYRELKSHSFDPSTYWTTRVDHRFSDKSLFYARYTWQRQWSSNYEGNLPTIGQLWNQRNTRALASSFTYSIRSNLLNEIRYGLNYNNNPAHGAVVAKQLIQDLGIRGLWDNLPDLHGILRVGFSGLAVQGISQTSESHPGNSQMAHIMQENLSWFRGRHSLKAGVNYLKMDWAELAAGDNLFGNLTFSNRFTGHPYADFLVGIPTTMARQAPPLFNEERRNSYDFFVQDDFKVSSRLTLNLGLRYEYHPYWREEFGRLSAFDIKTGKIVVPDGALSQVSPQYPQGFVDIVEAKQLGYPGQTLMRNDTNNFAPRIGMAYRPWGNNTVFRGGYGIFFDNIVYGLDEGSSPFVVGEPSYTNPLPTPVVILPTVFPASGSGAARASIPSAYRQDLRVPYTMQYNVTIERQQGDIGFRASYVGTASRQGIYRYNINQPRPGPGLFVDKPRLFPNFAGISYATNGAGHQYNGLTVEAKRRVVHGLMFQISWVFARDIGDIQWYYNSPEDSYNLKRERGPWVDVPTHRVAGSMIYELPFGKGRHFFPNSNRTLNTLIGGWELSVINLNQTGQFLTPSWSGPDPTGTAFTASSTPANVTIRPNILRDPNLPGDTRSVQRWFDATAFTAPTPGAFGNSGRGVIMGPGQTVWHATLAKYVSLYERVRLRAELSAFNIFNHPNWGNPGTNITSAPGVISSVDGRNDLDSIGQRSLRACLRLEW